MYTLYYSPGAASMAVHWMLLELKVPHELALVDLQAKQQQNPAYLRLNPSGTVPTLVVDGQPRTETAALLLLLAERHPEAALSPPPGTLERAEYYQWMLYLANTLQPAFRAWFYPYEPAGASHADAAKAQARQRIEAVWTRLDAKLAREACIVGDHLSAVDFLATILMRWSRNMPKPATEWPNVRAYVSRMRAMASLQRVHDKEQLADWMN
jgi:glutathione S-transferase